jgi:dolichyl-phosphate-mannose-protein mannosyltransferase
MFLRLLYLWILLLPILFAWLYLSWSFSLLLFVTGAGLWYLLGRGVMLAPLALLVASFLLYGLYSLGSHEMPQSFERLHSDQGATLFDFKKRVKIDRLCYFVGIDEGVEFELMGLRDQQWHRLYRYDQHYPYSFRWRCTPLFVQSNQLLWRIKKGAMMLHEVRFFYQNRPVSYRSSQKELNDEPHITIREGYQGGMVFDEIYFARTAYEIKEKLPIYENTHPYLGKEIIGVGIKLFGMNPFGWRVMGVIFGALMVVIFYYFALSLFKKPLYGVIAGVLMGYSFMHLAQARLALVDTFGVLFVILSYWMLYLAIDRQERRFLWLSGIAFGLAISVKWSALFAIFGFMGVALYLLFSSESRASWLRGWRLLLSGLLAYGVVAFGVYLLSFWDIWMRGGGLMEIYAYNLNSYHYHATLNATHPYSSPWWSWILNLKPMGYYKQMEGTLLHSLNSFGNPAIFWFGLATTLYLLLSLLWRRSLERFVLLFGFLALYLPYAFVGRLMFIYHFYYALPFLMLSIVLFWSDMVEAYGNRAKSALLFYLMVVSLLFVLFYPLLSATPVEIGFVEAWLRWFEGWWF